MNFFNPPTFFIKRGIWTHETNHSHWSGHWAASALSHSYSARFLTPDSFSCCRCRLGTWASSERRVSPAGASFGTPSNPVSHWWTDWAKYWSSIFHGARTGSRDEFSSSSKSTSRLATDWVKGAAAQILPSSGWRLITQQVRCRSEKSRLSHTEIKKNKKRNQLAITLSILKLKPRSRNFPAGWSDAPYFNFFTRSSWQKKNILSECCNSGENKRSVSSHPFTSISRKTWRCGHNGDVVYLQAAV